MFIDELMEELRGLPFHEQQLMISLNRLVIKEYKKNSQNSNHTEALAKLEKLYDMVEKSINDNYEDSIDTVKSK